jgi:tRNA G10  N-methylase Trm11
MDGGRRATVDSTFNNNPRLRPRATPSLSWRPSCNHAAPTAPCVVLDPFCGSGTTLVVAAKLGHRAIGIDGNETYLRTIAEPRIRDEVGALLCWQTETAEATA